MWVQASPPLGKALHNELLQKLLAGTCSTSPLFPALSTPLCHFQKARAQDG